MCVCVCVCRMSCSGWDLHSVKYQIFNWFCLLWLLFRWMLMLALKQGLWFIVFAAQLCEWHYGWNLYSIAWVFVNIADCGICLLLSLVVVPLFWPFLNDLDKFWWDHKVASCLPSLSWYGTSHYCCIVRGGFLSCHMEWDSFLLYGMKLVPYGMRLFHAV